MATVKTTAGLFSFPANVQLHTMRPVQKGKSKFYECTTADGLEFDNRKTDRDYVAGVTITADYRVGTWEYIDPAVRSLSRRHFVPAEPEQWDSRTLEQLAGKKALGFVGRVDLLNKCEAQKNVQYLQASPVQYRNIVVHVFLLDELQGQVL